MTITPIIPIVALDNSERHLDKKPIQKRKSMLTEEETDWLNVYSLYTAYMFHEAADMEYDFDATRFAKANYLKAERKYIHKYDELGPAPGTPAAHHRAEELWSKRR